MLPNIENIFAAKKKNLVSLKRNHFDEKIIPEIMNVLFHNVVLHSRTVLVI